jgi:hypothetical protein
MKLAGGNIDRIVLHLVNEPVFLRDASRPITGQIMLEAFWFTEA